VLRSHPVSREAPEERVARLLLRMPARRVRRSRHEARRGGLRQGHRARRRAGGMEAAELFDGPRGQDRGWPPRGAAGPGWDAALRAAACVVGLVGVALRVLSLGRPGFWADEAWVAISTRVSGIVQFLVSLSVTPILWAALLRPLALLPLPPEIAL